MAGGRNQVNPNVLRKRENQRGFAKFIDDQPLPGDSQIPRQKTT